MEYRLVTHHGSGEVRHLLEPEMLVIEYEKTGRREQVLWGDITEINLRQEMHGIFSAHIKRSTGGTLRVPARHFVKLGQFEDRGAEYTRFIQQLHQAVRNANPRARFVAITSVICDRKSGLRRAGS